MNLAKIIRNHFAVFFLGALAVGGVVYLTWAIGANVNCIAGTCYSTNGQTDASSTYDVVFTGENDTASIESVGSGSSCNDNIFELGGGNDVAYISNPQTATAEPIRVEGQSGDDVILNGSDQNNCLNGGDGNDFIAGDADDRLYGGNGNDLLAGGQGNDVLGDADGNGSCANESDPNNDVFVGGPGQDTYCTDSGDGDDIVIIHKGDVPAGSNNEQYTCQGNDTILLFGFELDLVVEVKPTDAARFYNLTSAPGGLTNGQVAIGDLQNNPNKDPAGARYTFTAASGSTCTIIVVE